MAEDPQSSNIDAILRDVIENSTTVAHGPHYQELVTLIEEELVAQLAMERLGPVNPPAGGIGAVADLIADVVNEVYRLERRVRQ